MSGTVEGGQAAAKKNKKKYGADFYKRIGAKGGLRGRTGGFFQNRELARQAGKIGGTVSRRGKVPLTEEERKHAELVKLEVMEQLNQSKLKKLRNQIEKLRKEIEA
jgi:general stress protein YciG